MTYSKEELEQAVRRLGQEQAWNHAFELPHGVWTAPPKQTSRGKNLVKWERIRGYLEQIDLTGKRVLDVGCNDGFFSVQMTRAGAKEVVAIDISEHRINKARFVLDVLGIDNARVERLDIYDDRLKDLRRFDFMLCLGFLHRVPDLYGAVEVLTGISDMILFEWKAYRRGNPELPLLEFDGRMSVPEDPYSRGFFRPSIGAMKAMLRINGFEWFCVADDPIQHRIIMITSSRPHSIFKHQDTVGGANKLTLLSRYSRLYAAHVRDILKGKIRL